MNSIKILRSSNEFLYTQIKYDKYFLKGHIEFLEKENGYLQMQFSNLQRIIEEKQNEIESSRIQYSKNLEEKNKIIEHFETEKQKEIQKIFKEKEEEINKINENLEERKKVCDEISSKLLKSEKNETSLQQIIEKSKEQVQKYLFSLKVLSYLLQK